MTITNWELSPSHAAIVNDCLASDRDYAPHCFTTKGRALPHLQIIMGVKGAVHPMQALWERCMSGMLVRGVTELAAVAQPLLAHAYGQVRHMMPEDECAVFLFGWSTAAQRVVGFAYRVENGFECERLEDGAAQIPGLRGPIPGRWDQIARQQQWEDRSLPVPDRDNIGGWLVRHQLVAVPGEGRARIEIDSIGPMDHFQADCQLIAGRAELLPPDLARWDRCEPWLTRALAYDPAGRIISDVKSGYRAGQYTLYEGARSAALVEGTNMGGSLHVHTYLAGGCIKELTHDIRPQIEALARRIGAASVVLSGRRGWARAWRPYGYQFMARTTAKNWITIKRLAA